jgi:hypothetical protein
MAIPGPSGTLLVISGPGIADYSARGLTQSLDPVDASAVLARTVNGVLIDLSPAQMRKYKSTISCSDTETPALDGVWPGMQLTVDCVTELGYLTAGNTPQRTVVSGSSRVAGLWTYYRPRLEMRVTEYSVSRDEYGALTAWSLSLEEL